MKIKSLKQSVIKSSKSIMQMLPLLLGVVFLLGAIKVVVPKTLYTQIFGKNFFFDSLIGSGLGSIMAGNPITSYIMAGEFLDQGVTLFAVTGFIVAWVTVGVVQLPAESAIFGKRFGIFRNLTCFFFAVIISIIQAYAMGFFR